MIEIDGAAGEGGGQVLRTALSLALCTGTAFRISAIRGRRPRPGLMRQHLACVNAALAISGATARGAELGSLELVFEPGPVTAGDHVFQVGSAGSCTLVLQTVLPPLMRASGPSRIVLGGGTHNPMAPPYTFLERSVAPLLHRLGIGLDLELARYGFYPAGGGRIHATIVPAARGLSPFDLVERGASVDAYAECLAPGLPPRVAEREWQALSKALGWPDDRLRPTPIRADEGPGNALIVTLVHDQVTEVITGFGEKGLASERVARGVASRVRAHHTATGALGPWLADQWLLPLALAVAERGRGARFTCTSLTGHTTTNMAVIEAFLPVRFATPIVTRGHCEVVVTATVG